MIRKRILLTLLLLQSLLSFIDAQDIMLQGWYWDYPKAGQGKFWVDTIAQKSRQFAEAGFNYIWLPPMSRAASGNSSNGYDIMDYYDLGGTIPYVYTGFGSRAKVDQMIDSLDKYNIVPVADMVYNHRVGGLAENNDAVQGWIENYNLDKHNNGDQPYPSDRFRCILPIGAANGLGAGNYYFKVHSASGSTDYYNKAYVFYVYSKKKGWANLPDLKETANNGGADCSQGDDQITLGRNIDATVDAGGCGIDEFALTITNDDFNATGDTLFITLTNSNGNYSDHFIYDIWYSNADTGFHAHDRLKYQTYTNFSNVISKRGYMNYLNFKPNGNSTCLCGDWDAMLFFYDIDQYVLSSADTLKEWTRWMMENVGVKGLRIDAVKNFTPEFTGNLLDSLHRHNDNPKMIVGESYDYGANTLKSELDAIYSYMDNDTKNAMYVSLFDFNLQASLRDACDAFGDDVRNVFSSGMHGAENIFRKNIVTFVNNHDFRDPSQSTDNDPILAYTYIITNPIVGIPCIYWSDYFSKTHPTYFDDINKLLRVYYNFIQGAQNVEYLTRFNSPFVASYSSGGASTSLIDQLSGMSNTCLADRDVVVAINFSGSPLKVDIAVNTGSPYHLHTGDTLVDILGRSDFPYALVNANNQVYVSLPARSYSVWARVPVISSNPVIAANGSTSFCNGSEVGFNLTSPYYACHSYQWKRNGIDINAATTQNYAANISGNYQLEENYNGAMAHLSNIITVNVKPGKPIITSDGTLLTANIPNVFYQWYFGKDSVSMTVIDNANSQTYTPSQSGYYKVMITDSGGCSDISKAVAFYMVGINEPSSSKAVEIFPNPANETVNYNLKKAGCKQIEIADTNGNEIISQKISESTRKGTIDLHQLPSGSYFMKFIFESDTITLKFQKQGN